MLNEAEGSSSPQFSSSHKYSKTSFNIQPFQIDFARSERISKNIESTDEYFKMFVKLPLATRTKTLFNYLHTFTSKFLVGVCQSRKNVSLGPTKYEIGFQYF